MLDYNSYAIIDLCYAKITEAKTFPFDHVFPAVASFIGNVLFRISDNSNCGVLSTAYIGHAFF